MGIEEATELLPADDGTLQLLDYSEWTEFVQAHRNPETADTLNNKVTCSAQDDDYDNDDGVPPPIPYEYQSYLK